MEDWRQGVSNTFLQLHSKFKSSEPAEPFLVFLNGQFCSPVLTLLSVIHRHNSREIFSQSLPMANDYEQFPSDYGKLCRYSN